MDTRQQFEAYVIDNGIYQAFGRRPDGEYYSVAMQERWGVWQAATKAEREACAEVCDAEEAEAQKTDSPDWGDCCGMLAKMIRARDTERGG